MLNDETLKAIDSILSSPNKPGKGKKLCSNCQEYVGARTVICACGYSFKDGTTNNVKVETKFVSSTFAGPGKGRKKCDSCNKYIGARSITCPNCGADTKKEKVEEVTTAVDQKDKEPSLLERVPEYKFAIGAGFSTRLPLIHTPSGYCPIKLANTDKDTVVEWCEDILDLGKRQNKVYLPSSIKYWLRFIHPIGTKEYDQVSKIITDWAEELESGIEVSEIS